jgi:hypothetical protein
MVKKTSTAAERPPIFPSPEEAYSEKVTKIALSYMNDAEKAELRKKIDAGDEMGVKRMIAQRMMNGPRKNATGKSDVLTEHIWPSETLDEYLDEFVEEYLLENLYDILDEYLDEYLRKNLVGYLKEFIKTGTIDNPYDEDDIDIDDDHEDHFDDFDGPVYDYTEDNDEDPDGPEKEFAEGFAMGAIFEMMASLFGMGTRCNGKCSSCKHRASGHGLRPRFEIRLALITDESIDNNGWDERFFRGLP